MNISVEKFDCFNVYHENDATQFFHVEINNNSFYKNLFDYFFSEDNLLQYAENISSITFFPSKKNFVTLFKQLKVFIDQKNQEISIEKLDNYLRTLLIDDGKLIDKDGKVGILLDKIGKIGEYIFCCLLSDYFKFDCIIPKVHLQTDYNMSVYGIDTLYYSQQNDLLLFGESKVSKSVSNGIKLINASLKDYKQQLESEFTLILSDRLIKNNLNFFTKKYGAIAELCLNIEDFIKEANIKHIGIPVFIAHGTEINHEAIFTELNKIKKQDFFNIQTQYFLITLPILDKENFSKEFTKYIKIKEDEYERNAKQ